MTIRDLIQRIERDRWRLVREVDRIHQYQHPLKDGNITIAGKADEEIVASAMKDVFTMVGFDETKD